jgi:hypothetical protein
MAQNAKLHRRISVDSAFGEAGWAKYFYSGFVALTQLPKQV